MIRQFIFIGDRDFVERLRGAVTEEDFRGNVMKVAKGDYFRDDGHLIYEPWLSSMPEFKADFDRIRASNLYYTGDPSVSYDDLCDFQAEFEAKYGAHDGFQLDADEMEYQLALTQYCIDRARNLI